MVRDRSIVSKGVDAWSRMKVATAISLVSASQPAIPSPIRLPGALRLCACWGSPMRAIITKNDQETCNIAHAERLDLREDPGAIARIDCARQYPNLRALLLNLNAEESPFSTFGCKVWASTEALGATPNELASRIALVFSQGSGEPGEVQYADFARRLAELLESEPGDGLRAELQISPAKLAGGPHRFCMRVFPIALRAGGNS